jgi:hypothetical protein
MMVVIVAPVVVIVVDVLPHILAFFHHVFPELLAILA